jgi:hypothetical protein
MVLTKKEGRDNVRKLPIPFFSYLDQPSLTPQLPKTIRA